MISLNLMWRVINDTVIPQAYTYSYTNCQAIELCVCPVIYTTCIVLAINWSPSPRWRWQSLHQQPCWFYRPTSGEPCTPKHFTQTHRHFAGDLSSDSYQTNLNSNKAFGLIKSFILHCSRQKLWASCDWCRAACCRDELESTWALLDTTKPKIKNVTNMLDKICKQWSCKSSQEWIESQFDMINLIYLIQMQFKIQRQIKWQLW